MLKVNTKKISLKEFAKKYGLSLYSKKMKFKKKWPATSFVKNEKGDWILVWYPCLAYLADMITNGDVIKEEDK